MRFRIFDLMSAGLVVVIGGCSLAPTHVTSTERASLQTTPTPYQVQAYATAEFPAQIGGLTIPTSARMNQPVVIHALAARPTRLDVIKELRISVDSSARIVQVTAIREAPRDRLVAQEFQGYVPVSQTFVPTVPGLYQIIANRGVNLGPLTLEVK